MASNGMHAPSQAPSDVLATACVYAVVVALGLVLALPAVVVGLTVYQLATRRGWRWGALALPGLAITLAVVGAGWALTSDPAAAFVWHALGLRELFANTPGSPALADLTAARWTTWLVHELPLSTGAALLGAGLVLEHIGSTPAHELSPLAQRRRQRHAVHVEARARTTAGTAPLTAGRTAQPVLGAWVQGDLHDWHTGPWATIPDRVLGLGTALLGVPGAGKTETLLRLAELGLARGWDVHVLDAKGDPATAARFAGLCQIYEVTPRLFPAEAYDGWRGDPAALRNRLARIVDYTEPYYADGARDLLAHLVDAPGGPPRSLPALLAAIAAANLDGLDPAVRRGTLARYRAFAAAAAGSLDGAWAYEDTRASYLLLDGVALGDDAPRLARYLVEDFAHYAAARKPPDRRALLLVDEFSALRLPNAAALVERLRSFGAGIVIAAQSPEGLHDDAREADRLLAAAATIIAHRIANPDPIVTRAGTVKRPERSHQLDGPAATGAGSLRMQDAYRIDPNDLRSLPPGVAWIVHGGHAAKIAVARTNAPTVALPLPAPASPVVEEHPPLPEPAPVETPPGPSPAAQQF
ncbi:MAG: hypothetical protein AB1673_14515 [Actinomycetota bacterium]|jgi:hypothetical protein